jgi:peptidoglycan/xylan/chitin deacetylase (PgdA/CDA1 family)
MAEPRRRTHARSRRSVSPWSALALLVAVVVVIAGVSALLGACSAKPTRASAPSAPVTLPATQAVQAATPPPAVVASQTPTQSVDASETTSATSADLAAIKASEQAIADAAVSWHNAPALSPTLKSIGGLRLHPKHKYVAITLDDGYGFQIPMLDLLEKYHARCTTFLIGEWMAQNKAIVKRLDHDGFEIANHTWSHVNLTNLSAGQVASQLTRTQAVISGITGNQAPYLRPPGGATDPAVKRVASSLGYHIVLWDRTFGESRAYYHVIQERGGVQPGDVILCHWGDVDAYQEMDRILSKLKAQGYEFVTLSELVADSK